MQADCLNQEPLVIWLDSQKWMISVISDSVLFVNDKTEQGDHFLAFNNPQKFAADLHNFLQRY